MLTRYEPKQYEGNPAFNALRLLVKELFPNLSEEDAEYAAVTLRGVAIEEVEEHYDRVHRDHSDD